MPGQCVQNVRGLPTHAQCEERLFGVTALRSRRWLRAQTVPRHDVQHRLGRHVRGGFSNVLAGSPRRPEHSQTRGVGLISSPGHETGYLGPRGDAWRGAAGHTLYDLP